KLEIIIGPKTNGTNINGLSTIGVPKIIGSLIPNIAGGNDILPNVLYRLLFEKNNNKIANPIVAPEPPITKKELKNPQLKTFVCSSPLAIISKFSRPKGSHTL